MNIEQQFIATSSQPAHAVSQQGSVAARTPATAAARPETPAVSLSDLKAAAQQIDSYLKSVGRNLSIHVDEGTGRTVVVVTDSESGDVIRQIPSEEALRLARSLGESAAALVSLTA